jgi:hypothetical protein
MNDDTTLYIIAYDIPDDKRRTKVHKVLCGMAPGHNIRCLNVGSTGGKYSICG